MILADTSVWIAHLRAGDGALVGLLERGLVLGHPWVTGELALGRLTQRREIIAHLTSLPQATVATTDEVLTLVENQRLYGRGIGYVDTQLLTATHLTPEAELWTADKPLAAAASSLGCAFDPSTSGADTT
ncbi:MAG: VapC toxin family PIN domain ribonuclease [Actinobacteria bacterium]|nr:VapC toxin family PIN domain ribonuclease [Actinomycetota bacterium]